MFNKEKQNFYLSLIVVVIVSKCVFSSEFEVLKKYGLISGSNDTNIRITYHTKADVKKNIFEYCRNTQDSIEAIKQLKRIWPDTCNIFIDSAYQYYKPASPEKRNVYNGFFIQFYGDGTYYVKGYYLNGKKDSTWVNKTWSGTYIENYKNGKLHGDLISYSTNGKITYRQKWKNGNILDTSFSWFDNGQLKEIEIFKDGKSFYHKCYTEKGEETFCNPD